MIDNNTASHVESRRNPRANLDAKIEHLRSVTSVLLAEVRTLRSPKDLDVKNGIDFYAELRRFETELIERALDETGGNQKRAARLLGLGITTLNSKIKRYEIAPTRNRASFGVNKNDAG